MANIAASDVTYSYDRASSSWIGARGYSNEGTVAFGNGTLTYPAGGIPLTKASMGCPNYLESIEIIEQTVGTTGFVYRYDRTNEKLMIFSQGLLTSATGPAAAGATGAVATNAAASEVAAYQVIGTSASTAYNLGPLHQVSALAIAAQTLRVRAIGY